MQGLYCSRCRVMSLDPTSATAPTPCGVPIAQGAPPPSRRRPWGAPLAKQGEPAAGGNGEEGGGGGVGETRATRWVLPPPRCGAVQPRPAGAAVSGVSGGIGSGHNRHQTLDTTAIARGLAANSF